MLKGPTGCGKTRFVEHMSWRLKRTLVTVACHEDLTASDLVGKYTLRGDETVWQDGPLTTAVKAGGIAYLDEVVEARKDTTVVIHPLTDDRRILPLEKKGEIVSAPDDFHAGHLLQPGLPVGAEGPQALHQAALRGHRVRLPAARTSRRRSSSPSPASTTTPPPSW